MSKGTSVRSTSNFSNGYSFELRKGPWTLEEDNLLIHHVTSLGEGHWNSLARCSGLKRTGKSCRLRWLNYLKPDVKRGNLTPQEQLLILELHSKWGNRWSKIAKHLPGRTDNEIKNYWRTKVQKQARQLKVDSNSTEFVEAIKSFWLPRLLEKMEQCPSSLSSISSCSTTTTIEEKQNSTFSSPLKINQQEFSKSESPRLAENSTSCYHLETTSSSYFEESFMEQPTDLTSLVESQDMSMSEYDMAEADWFTDQVSGSLWNIE